MPGNNCDAPSQQLSIMQNKAQPNEVFKLKNCSAFSLHTHAKLRTRIDSAGLLFVLKFHC